MAIRIRSINGIIVALDATRSDPAEGDIYLDDAIHHALSNKFAMDFNEQYNIDIPLDISAYNIMLLEEINNSTKRWHDALCINQNIVFISGHLDITKNEFSQYYEPYILEYIDKNYFFVVGDARGVDTLAQELLCQKLGKGCDKVRVYHMFTQARNNAGEFVTIGGFTSDEDRDASMTASSNVDIAWIRPGRENSGTAKNIKRRKLSLQNNC